MKQLTDEENINSFSNTYKKANFTWKRRKIEQDPELKERIEKYKKGQKVSDRIFEALFAEFFPYDQNLNISQKDVLDGFEYFKGVCEVAMPNITFEEE